MNDADYMPKERPIIFNGEMVRALLEGRKTMTRRVIKPQPHQSASGIWYVPRMRKNVANANGENWMVNSPAMIECCPYGQPGDLLWVRETFAGVKGRPIYQGNIFYRADGEVSGRQEPLSYYEREDRWRPSIHMPKWAARIWLKVTDVHVERVQDISDADAKAEGAFFTDYGRNCGHGGGPWRDVGDCPALENTHPQRNGWAMVPTTSDTQCLGAPRWAFANLWERINAARGYGWDENPWVWVVEFERTEAP